MDTEFNISNAELVVMRVVWSLGEARVDEINAQLSPDLDWSLATVKTLLGRLVKKGMLSTEKEGRKFVYRPTMVECTAINLMSNELLKKVCSTKHGQLLGDMIEQAQLTETDIEKLITQLKATQTVERVTCNCLEESGACACKHNEVVDHAGHDHH